MRLVSHPNVVELKAFFYSNGDKKDEVYLNLVLEYVPETVYRASRHYAKLKQVMPMLQVKLYMYQVSLVRSSPGFAHMKTHHAFRLQLFRSLAYIHSVGICHRDIKPQNLLLNPATGVLKLCDFGSAKILIAGEPNVSYICSRYYRAPELIFGATNYTTHIGKLCFVSLSLKRRKGLTSGVFGVLNRYLVHRMCHGRIDAGTTLVPRRVRNRSIG